MFEDSSVIQFFNADLDVGLDGPSEKRDDELYHALNQLQLVYSYH